MCSLTILLVMSLLESLGTVEELAYVYQYKYTSAGHVRSVR